MSSLGIVSLLLILFFGGFFIRNIVYGNRVRGRLSILEDRLEVLWERSQARRPVDFLAGPDRRAKASLEHRKRRLHRLMEPLEREKGLEPDARSRLRRYHLAELERRLTRLEEWSDGWKKG